MPQCENNRLNLPVNGFSPLAANPGKYEFYRTEWPNCVCLLLFFWGRPSDVSCWFHRATFQEREQEISEKFDLVEEKIAQV
ncbi:hypothetical protein F442_00426 [Phytophthora nicotianae P10297]|uniref:Uncharacterized protein n=1 Tax=Phytophthora nicotianae P10297 TaxID=1317064 RepID=W3A5V5_PHYNI|nr:hypothetical protein F442_00426 [Phytophthora nicotianae P10297]